MISHLLAFAAGGAVVYCFPRVAAFGASVFRAARSWWAKIGK